MPSDVETQLSRLGRAWDDAADPVGVAEVEAHRRWSATDVELEPIDLEPPAHPHRSHRSWWLLGAVAALVALAVGALLALGPDRGSSPVPADESPVPTSPEPTTVTTVEPSGTPTTTPAVTESVFDPTQPMAGSCASCPAVLLDDGRVLVDTTAGIELFDPGSWSFTPLAVEGLDALDEAFLRRGVQLADGRVLLVGFGTAALVDLEQSTVERIALPEEDVFVPVALRDGRVLVFGPSGAYRFDADTRTFARLTPMAETGGLGDVVVPLADGRVLVTEGQFAPSRAAEIFDPTTDTFTRTGERSTTSSYPTATLLPDGRVLLAGGIDGSGDGAAATAELFDPATGTFTPTGSMSVGRQDHVAALTRDGTVLVVGGFDAGASTTAELYDPATGTFSPAPSPSGPRGGSTAVALADGSVLILGWQPVGNVVSDRMSQSAEVYGGEPPSRCCPANPDLVTVTDDVDATATDRYQVRLVIPASASADLTDVTGEWDLSSTPGPDVPLEVELPAGCGRGCEVVIPIERSLAKAGRLMVWIYLAYAGPAPLAASDVRVVVEPA